MLHSEAAQFVVLLGLAGKCVCDVTQVGLRRVCLEENSRRMLVRNHTKKSNSVWGNMGAGYKEGVGDIKVVQCKMS